MSRTVQALSTILPVLYMTTALMFGMELGGPKAPRPLRTRALVAFCLLLAHLGYLTVVGFHVGHLPVTDPWRVLSCIAVCLLATWILVERATDTPATGVFVIGFAFVLQLLSSAFAERDPAPSRLAHSPFFLVHVGTAVLAVATLLLSGFYGALYLLLLREIRSKRFGVLFSKLPDLETLSRLNRGAATLGFILLTGGINLGIWWAHAGGVEKFSYFDPKVLPVLVIWLIFGVIGASRWIRFLSGRRAAQIAVVATSLLLVTFVITMLPVGRFHVFR